MLKNQSCEASSAHTCAQGPGLWQEGCASSTRLAKEVYHLALQAQAFLRCTRGMRSGSSTSGAAWEWLPDVLLLARP